MQEKSVLWYWLNCYGKLSCLQSLNTIMVVVSECTIILVIISAFWLEMCDKRGLCLNSVLPVPFSGTGKNDKDLGQLLDTPVDSKIIWRCLKQ